MLFWQLEQYGTKILKKAGVDSPALSSHILLKYASGFSDLEYILNKCQKPSQKIKDKFFKILLRRQRGEPVAYILAAKEFYGRKFSLSAATLIPRPETELLVDIALKAFSDKPINFLDIGCGSGCIGLTLLAERSAWTGFLVDNSLQALHTAKLNAARFNIAANFICSDIFNWSFKANVYNLVISNPPYISFSEKDEVMDEVINFEPFTALFSNKDGLSHIEALIKGASHSLTYGGKIIIEHGYKQRDAILKLLRQANFQAISSFTDLANIPRCVLAIKNKIGINLCHS